MAEDIKWGEDGNNGDHGFMRLGDGNMRMRLGRREEVYDYAENCAVCV